MLREKIKFLFRWKMFVKLRKTCLYVFINQNQRKQDLTGEITAQVMSHHVHLIAAHSSFHKKWIVLEWIVLGTKIKGEVDIHWACDFSFNLGKAENKIFSLYLQGIETAHSDKLNIQFCKLSRTVLILWASCDLMQWRGYRILLSQGSNFYISCHISENTKKMFKSLCNPILDINAYLSFPPKKYSATFYKLKNAFVSYTIIFKIFTELSTFRCELIFLPSCLKAQM